MVSITFFFTKPTAITQKAPNIAYNNWGPSLSSKRKNSKPTRKLNTQCTDIQNAIAFALIRLGNISARRRPGTGPAPMANENTHESMPPTERKKAAEFDAIVEAKT
nr:hypothetical protein Iba_chr02cCG13620 [Ipomoea batatas]